MLACSAWTTTTRSAIHAWAGSPLPAVDHGPELPQLVIQAGTHGSEAEDRRSGSRQPLAGRRAQPGYARSAPEQRPTRMNVEAALFSETKSTASCTSRRAADRADNPSVRGALSPMPERSNAKGAEAPAGHLSCHPDVETIRTHPVKQSGIEEHPCWPGRSELAIRLRARARRPTTERSTGTSPEIQSSPEDPSHLTMSIKAPFGTRPACIPGNIEGIIGPCVTGWMSTRAPSAWSRSARREYVGPTSEPMIRTRRAGDVSRARRFKRARSSRKFWVTRVPNSSSSAGS